MEGSGVRLNWKALNHLHLLCKSSSSSSTFLHFHFQPLSFLSSSTIIPPPLTPRTRGLNLSYSSSSFSSPSSRFSSLSTTPDKVNGSYTPYYYGVGVGVGVGQANATETEPIPDNSDSDNNMLQVVLVSPQIPGNTGCIARTCAASGVKLHLVKPLGFEIDDTKLKRAGLDYWPYVVVKVHPSWAEFRDYFSLQDGEKRLLAFTKRGTALHSDFSYRPGDWLVFGSETTGLPPDALLDCKNEPHGGGAIKIPMVDTYVRCLNLSVSVGIAVYEAARQLNYEQLQYSSETCINGEKPIITEDIFA